MVEDGVDFGDEGEFVGVPFLRGSEYLSAGDDFVEKGVDGNFLVGGPSRVVEADAGCSVAFVDVDRASGHVDSTGTSLRIFDESANGFFGSGANSVIGVVLTDVVVLCDQVGGAVTDGLDDVCHSDSFVDALSTFLELFVGEVVFGYEESECLWNGVVAVSVLGGKLVGREAGGGHAGCARECSSCCC